MLYNFFGGMFTTKWVFKFEFSMISDYIKLQSVQGIKWVRTNCTEYNEYSHDMDLYQQDSEKKLWCVVLNFELTYECTLQYV